MGVSFLCSSINDKPAKKVTATQKNSAPEARLETILNTVQYFMSPENLKIIVYNIIIPAIN